MRTFNKQDNLTITRKLRLGPGAKLATVDHNGAEKNISLEELASVDGAIASAVAVLTAGAATDEMDITITVKDANGEILADSHRLEVWITDDAAALTLTGTSASGALTAVDGGILSVLTAKKHVICVTPATGIINLSLVDSGNEAGELVVVALPNGLFSISAASVAGSYEGG